MSHCELPHAEVELSINYKDFFPYEDFRAGQRETIETIENDCRAHKNIIAVAPNGFGKTITVLSAVLPVALDNNLRVIYCCRTHVQNARVIEELIKIYERMSKIAPDRKHEINGISIKGRGEMCLNPLVQKLNLPPGEAMIVCKQLRDTKKCKYHTKFLQNKKQLETEFKALSTRPLGAEEMITYCEGRTICPYFVSKALLEHARVIICNYQWIFNQDIREVFLGLTKAPLEECILVMDECHNLPAIATEIQSDSLGSFSLSSCANELKQYRATEDLERLIKVLANNFRDYGRDCEEEMAVNPNDAVKLIRQELGKQVKLEDLLGELQDFGEAIRREKLDQGQAPRVFTASVAQFWLNWIATSNRNDFFHCVRVERSEGRGKRVFLEIVCLDPRPAIKPVMEAIYASISMSGTVIPTVFNRLAGYSDLSREHHVLNVKTPFSRRNVKAMIIEGLDTRRDNRTESTYLKMMPVIEQVILATPKNVGIFCASYPVLEGLIKAGLPAVVERCHKDLFSERPGMSSTDNHEMIQRYKQVSLRNGGVLVGVCGGRNSEGEDFPGDFMNAAIIVGVPFQRPTPRVDAKIKYYDTVFDRQGWTYAYLVPAIERSNQACGRPVRLITDRAAIVLLDDRFKQRAHWLSGWIKDSLEILPNQPGIIYEEIRDLFKAER